MFFCIIVIMHIYYIIAVSGICYEKGHQYLVVLRMAIYRRDCKSSLDCLSHSQSTPKRF